jgi:uncharacterized protein (TIGR02001 family)
MNLKTTHSMLLAGLFAACSVAQAQTAAPAPAPAAASPFSFNVGVVTDYRFRGISQSRLRPALQGGVDWAHSSGFYLGFWGSTIRILEDIPGGKGPVELDFYGGYKGKINDTFSYDVGLLRYQYPRNNFPTTVNTTELYGAVSFGPATLKYSHSLGKETFGVPNSRGTGYLEAAATFDLGQGFALTPHIGYQRFRGSNAGVSNDSFASYVDYSLNLVKDMGNGFFLSGGVFGTDTKDPFYKSGANNKDLGKSGVVLGAKYTF